MNNQEKLIERLELYKEKYTVNGNKVFIDTGTPLGIYILFDNGKQQVRSKFFRWNFLTGFLRMSLYSSLRYLTFLMLLLIGLFCVFHFYTLNKGIIIETQVMIFELGIVLILCIWVSLIFVYFHNEFLHKKQQIIAWLDR